MKPILLDTNLFVDWINQGLREDLLIGPGWVRYLSAVVLLELRAGAMTRGASRAVDGIARSYRDGGRLLSPGAAIFDGAGRAIQRLRRLGVGMARTSTTNDVLIALTARSKGATLYTRDRDFAAIRRAIPFDWVLVD